ncbi:uncharacterized protein LOC111406154 isoform X1 [Olea europaea var. sylvestris]|uniref:uncharacterized protein LOC111406154 isoform X1 n=2 Tax=Olea europaea var. sylvestris TaxID=158386 RepID=UPI000C1CCFA1|nr:uncharacterized protein LOC111406154 isoform X1 [Olea europaea var. sylvestris]
MGTKLHCESYLTGYYFMRNLNEDSSCSSWPLSYGDKNLTNVQCYNGFTPRIITDGYPGYDKNALRQKILEHEAVFKNQVNELHRLYGIQRDMMEEIKRKELHKHWESVGPSSSSSRQVSQMPQDNTQTWCTTGSPLLNSGYGKTSTSGVEIVNSPLSCTKGYNMPAGHSPLQNGCSSKDFEELNLRPTKIRKKLFDLQLPADEYIETEEREKLQDNKISSILSYTSNEDQKVIPERSMEIFLGASANGKTCHQKDASGSGSCLRSFSGLADLNVPVQLDEATAPSSADFLGHTSNHGEEIKRISQSTKPNVGFPFLNSFRDSKVNARGLLSHMNEAGPSKGNPNLVTQSFQKDKVTIPSHPAEVLLNQAHHPPGLYPTGHSGEVIWRNGLDHGLESSNRNSSCSNYSHLDPAVASHIPDPNPFVHSGFANSLSHSVPSWAKPTSSLGQKITTLSRSMQPSTQSQESFGDKWNGSYRLNPGSESDVAICNGFYHGSVSGSKEPVHLPSSGFDFLKCGRGDNVASERSVNPGFEKFLNGANHVNLNGVTTQSSPNEAVSQKYFNMMDRNSAAKDHLSVFPWLGCKTVDKKEAAKARKLEHSEILGSLQAFSNPLHFRSETVRDLNQVFTSNISLASNDCEIKAKGEIGKTENSQKILGFPIFEILNTPKHESSSLSTSVTLDCPSEGKNVKNEKKNILIDINLACESEEQIDAEELIVENKQHSMGTIIRSQIDLNTCITEDEDPSAPSVASNSANVKVVMEIDLEAPVLPEMEDDIIPGKEDRQNKASLQCTENKAEHVQDEVVRNAAKTIFVISSSCQQIRSEDTICYLSEASLAESILWFADVVSSCANELKGKDDATIQDLPKEIDDFEAMTLQLTETKEEDYMPKPIVPEILNVEEMGTTSLPSRSRRGHARRGRQRRDFQRDILPSLASLSRHEVTEDIQIFGGLMRATGHSWNSGLIRRNGTRNSGARGRRCKLVDTTPAPVESPVCTPLMQKLNNVEVGLEDRSLTGWGKTTRRPRRQRCPAGNPLIVSLT